MIIMLKFYCVHYTTYYKGQEVGCTTARALCDESKVENFRKKVTWENLADIWEELGGYGCNFSIWNMKKAVSFPLMVLGLGKSRKSGNTQTLKLKLSAIGLSVKYLFKTSWNGMTLKRQCSILMKEI